MKKITVLTVIFTSLFFVNLSAQKDMSNLKPEIKKINNKMISAMMNNNNDEIMNFYAEDAISLPSYQPMMKGMKALKENMKKSQQSGMKMKEFTIDTKEIFGTDNLVYEIGTYKMSMEMPNMKEPFKDEGKYLTVWQKIGGNWKIKVETWNTDLDPWKMMEEKNQKADREKSENKGM